MPTLHDDIDRLATLHFIALVNAYVTGLGHTTACLLEGTEVSAADLDAADKLITPAEEFVILRNALRLTKAEHLGLELGSRCRLASYGLFGFTLLSSSDLRAALALFFEYPLPLGTGFSLALIQKKGVASLTVNANFGVDDQLHRLAIEFCLTALQSVIADLLYGVVRRNPRNFRQPSSSPATSASRSMNLPSVWKV
jgi:hypothetical protein